MIEIERKWIITELPDVGDQTPLSYERHFLFSDNKVEVRIQRKGEKFEFERKVESSDLTRTGQKFEITESEFNAFKGFSIASILREGYLIDGVSVKMYKGKHEGLIRAEVGFESEKQAKDFKRPDWFGVEITNSSLGRDKKLAFSSDGEFKSLLEKR